MLHAPQIKNALPHLSTVKSCAMVGCGTGYVDLPFVRECFPNLTELAAVEPDADQMAEFKTNVSQQIPSVSVDFYQETAQSWKGSSGKLFDAVLLFHSLYFVSPSERPVLFQKLLDHVLVSGGVVLIFIDPSRVSKLSLVPYQDIGGDQLSDVVTSVGFEDCYQLEIECQMDVQGPNDDLAALIVFLNEGKLSLEEARCEVEEKLSGLKFIPCKNWFGAFRKP